MKTDRPKIIFYTIKTALKASCLVLFVFTTLLSCTEPFTPPVEEHEDLLVIDALVTNAPPPYTVKLSRSRAFADPIGDPVENATVILINNLGEEEQFHHTNRGIYLSDSNGMKGIKGLEYQLKVITPEDEVYLSEFEELITAPEIDSLYYELTSKPTANPEKENIGFEFYIDSKASKENSAYYRVEFAQTHELHVPIVADELSQYKDRKICWATNVSSNIIIHSTAQLAENSIQKFPIHFVSTDTNVLYRKYSLQARLYALPSDAYSYFNLIKDYNHSTGTLFDKIPSSVSNNINNITTPKNLALGYFQVVGLSTKRIFIDRETDLPEDIQIDNGFNDCGAARVGIGENPQGKGYFYLYTHIEPNNNYDFYIKNFECVDCTLRGDNKKPDFWIY